MIVLEPDDLESGVVVGAARALDNDKHYAMVDSGTNAIIVPLHPSMRGEIIAFWIAMSDIASQSKLISGLSWMELRDMPDEQAQEPQPQSTQSRQ